MTTAAKKPRRTKEVRAAEEAARLAKLLAEAPALGPSSLAPPAFITVPRLAPALAVWRELASQLEDTGRLTRLDRFAFAALCFWQAEFIAAHDDVLKRGHWFMVKAVSGGKLPRRNPSVDRRNHAWDQVVALSVKFGLTPLDRIALNKAQRDGNLGDVDDEPTLPGMSTPPDTDGGSSEPDPWDKRLN